MTLPGYSLECNKALAEESAFFEDVVNGLAKKQKQIPSTWFYDHKGSGLFDQICELPEYYLTRTEIGIMSDSMSEIVQFIGSGVRLLEFGSGSSLKTKMILQNLVQPECYIPMDISEDFLAHSVSQLRQDFPGIPIRPVACDFTKHWNLPPRSSDSLRMVSYFPGSTIGNFQPIEAKKFLKRIHESSSPGDGFLIGIDLVKKPSIIEAAYNDSDGITAAFNFNLLERMEKELSASLNIDHFRHHAPWISEHNRVEMRLVARQKTHITLDDQRFEMNQGEYILTEYSCKYELQEFISICADCGFQHSKTWTDKDGLFAMIGFEI